MSTICKVCGMVDTRKGSSSGVDYCNDCYSIESGFHFIVDDFENLYVTENDELVDEYGEIVGSFLA